MSKKKILVSTIASFVFLTSCQESDNSEIVAKYEGGDITQKEFETKLVDILSDKKSSNFNNISPEIRKAVIQEIAVQEILKEKVEKSNIRNQADVKEAIEKYADRVTKKQLITQEVKKLIGDEQVQEQYDELVKNLEGKKEYHAKHILVKTKKEAQNILAKVNKDSSKFEELANEKSLDTANKGRGGDLGYFLKEQMVKPFADAISTMQKGKILSKPIKTDFGWHVIKLVDVRDAKPVEFEKVKDSIRAQLEQQAIPNYIESIINQANITISEPKTAEADPKAAEESAEDDAQASQKINSNTETTSPAEEQQNNG